MLIKTFVLVEEVELLRNKILSRYNLPGEENIMASATKKAFTEMQFLVMMFAANIPLVALTKPVTAALNGHTWKQLPFPWSFVPKDDDPIFVVFFLLSLLGLFFSHCLGKCWVKPSGWLIYLRFKELVLRSRVTIVLIKQVSLLVTSGSLAQQFFGESIDYIILSVIYILYLSEPSANEEKKAGLS